MNPFEILATVMLFASGDGWSDLSARIHQQMAIVVLQQIRNDHIATNVPRASKFDEYLQRDVHTYLANRAGADVAFSVDLLRRPPTQVGIAFPKYYVWIEASSPTQGDLSGAARIAAINGREFDIQQFVTRRDINSRPDDLYQTFPSRLVPHVLDQARGYIRHCLP